MSALTWNQLTLLPSHAEQLRRWLANPANQQAIYNVHQAKFDASDLAFLVSGMNRDGDHGVGDGVYHRLHTQYQQTTGKGLDARCQRANFKLKYDRLVFDVVSFLSNLKTRKRGSLIER